MPTYDYRCVTCGTFEWTQSFSDADLAQCPTCGAPAPARLFTATRNIVVKSKVSRDANAEEGEGLGAEMDAMRDELGDDAGMDGGLGGDEGMGGFGEGADGGGGMDAGDDSSMSGPEDDG